MEKQIYDLGPSDLVENPVWIFPMDDTVADEESVRPATAEFELEDLQVIVRTGFQDQMGNEYLGYIYWGEPSSVDHLNPVVFFDESGESGMSFWNGMFEPGDDEFEQAKGVLSNKSFPMKFKSEDMLGLYPIIGTLEGIYYLDGDDNIACKVIS